MERMYNGTTGMNRRDFLTAGAATTLATVIATRAPAATPAAGAQAGQVDALSLVDPELRPPLEEMQRTMGRFVASSSTLAQARRPWITEPPAPTPVVDKRLIPGRNGAPEVPVFVINAKPGAEPRPAIVHLHGGGYIGGSAAQAVPVNQRIAAEHDCVVVSVEYRLAPETRFPGSLEDNYAALEWVHDSAANLGVDPARIAVMGESAGGGHAAMLAIAARDRGEVPLVLQLLIYPMLDDRTGSTRRPPPPIGAFLWVPESNRYGWTSLLGVPAGSRAVPAGAVPARERNLGGLAPAFIGVGSIDLFVDEDIEYARRLIDAGVPTELVIVPGAYHGFDGVVPQAAASRRFRTNWNAALTKAFTLKASG